MRIAILVPTLGRAHVLKQLAENIADVTPPGRYQAIFVCDWEDRASSTILQRIGARIVYCNGTYPVKTNAGYRASSAALVVPTADDVVFHLGWYEAALEAFADDWVQVVGTRDLTPITTDGSHSTMPILRCSYITNPGAVWGEPGKVFHEGYHHGWVETELWQLACHRGVARFIPESIIEHRHPDWGTRPADETDMKGNYQNKPADNGLFNERRTRWLAAEPAATPAS